MKKHGLKILVFGALFGLACTTKVSEWILLNEEPQKYALVYFYKHEITESARIQNNQLQEKIKQGNVLFKTVKNEQTEVPFYALYFNNKQIAAFEDYQSLANLTTSPLREKIAGELMEGKLCVMLYLKCGDSEKDEAGLTVLKNTLGSSPFGKVISVAELDRNSSDEQLLASMLLHVEDDLHEINEPMLFGVFGRFRVLEPLLARGISEENIRLMIDYFTADCSCLIKDNLPGRSMLYGADWEKPKPALVNVILDANPELMHR